MYQIIDGKKISQEIKEELKAQVAVLKEQGKSVCLAVIQVGNDPASSVYVGNKKKACAYIGIESLSYELPEETTQQELLELVRKLNADDKVNGILVQLPLPEQIDEGKVIQTIAPEKDVPWENIETYSNGNVMTPICRLSADTPDASLIVSAQKKYQGRACLEAYAAFIEDYTFAGTFNVAVVKNARVVTRSYEIIVDNKVTKTENELKYVLTIPEELRQPGKSFRLLGIGEGVVNIYDDLDLDDSTITFATSTPSTAYALVYK